MIYLFGSLLKKLIVISELRKTMMDLFTGLFVLKTMLNYDEQKTHGSIIRHQAMDSYIVC